MSTVVKIGRLPWLSFHSYHNIHHNAPLSEFGPLPLMRVNVKGVQDVFNQHHDKTSKGIKAHILLDDSGLIGVDSVEAIFETIVPVVNETEAGWMDSVTNFFSGTVSIFSYFRKLLLQTYKLATTKFSFYYYGFIMGFKVHVSLATLNFCLMTG